MEKAAGKMMIYSVIIYKRQIAQYTARRDATGCSTKAETANVPHIYKPAQCIAKADATCFSVLSPNLTRDFAS